MKNSRWTIVLGVIAFLVLVSMVWASPPPDVPLVPPQASPGFDADKVDGHHAGPASGSKAQRANRVLWANAAGVLSVKALPVAQLNNRYLNDDRQETISAAVAGTLLTVENTGTGANVTGLSAKGEDLGVYGYGSSSGGYGVMGVGNIGVYGFGMPGVKAESVYGVPLLVEGYSTNLIEAWDTYTSPDNLRFKVVRSSGDVRADGTFTSPANDFAEMIAVEGQPSDYEPADLLVLSQSGSARLSSSPNATNIIGVYSTKPAFLGGAGESEEEDDRIPVAITGIVPLKASTENGAIVPGDLLTSSSIPGHAMKASPVTIDGVTFYLPGTILGKALEPLEEGTGVISVLVTLQ